MNYLNKFGNIVSKGINNIKGQIMNNKANDYANKGVNSFDNNQPVNEEHYLPKNSNYYNNQPKYNKPTSSLTAFLMGASQSKKEKTMSQIDEKEFLKDFKLIRGEVSVSTENCEIKLDNKDFACKALLTNYRLYLIPNFLDLADKYKAIFPINYFNIPIHQITNVDIIKETTKNFKLPVNISLKDQRSFLLLFKVGHGSIFCNTLSDLVKSVISIGYADFAKKYNFDYHPTENGWLLYNPKEEFARQGLTNLETNSHFRYTSINENFFLCETYPKFLICPADISDAEYQRASEFRTKNRVPTLSYFFYQTKGSIWRSSQVKGGILNNRNSSDESLINAITHISEKKKIAVFDCRPYLSAYANKLKGAGPESVDNYHDAKLTFCNIDNIHTARHALKDLYTYINSKDFNEDKSYMSKYEGTKWTDFIFLLIKRSIDVANSIKEGMSVLIHCSDGWDRASQMTAFSQLLIDPYFRTLRGYMILIEKDFLSFGHQCKFRNGYYDPKSSNETQESPIILQFLDATSQLLVQYPMYFEFNMNFLVFVANHINTGKYGTFLFNCERERDNAKVVDNYCSIWSDVLESKELFLNELYNVKTKDVYCFTPKFSPHQIRLWTEFFFQNAQLNFAYNYQKCVGDSNNNNTNIKDELINTRTLSSFEYYYNKIDDIKEKLNKKEKENNNMNKAILELISKGIISDDVLESCSNETKEAVNKAKAEGVKYNNVFGVINKNINNVSDINEIKDELNDINNKNNNASEEDKLDN